MSLRPAAGKSKPCPPKPGAVVEPKPRRPLERRGELARKPAKPGGGSTLKAKPKRRPKEGPLTPADWHTAVCEQQGWRCAVTGQPLGLTSEFDVHHVIPKSRLRARGWHHLVWDRRNGLAVIKVVHDEHESHKTPIPREALSDCHAQFARECDALDGTEAFTERLLADYPREGR